MARDCTLYHCMLYCFIYCFCHQNCNYWDGWDNTRICPLWQLHLTVHVWCMCRTASLNYSVWLTAHVLCMCLYLLCHNYFVAWSPSHSHSNDGHACACNCSMFCTCIRLYYVCPTSCIPQVIRVLWLWGPQWLLRKKVEQFSTMLAYPKLMFSQSTLTRNLVLNCSFVLRSLSHLHVATKGQLAANFSLFGSISLATHVHVSVHAFICSSTQTGLVLLSVL